MTTQNYHVLKNSSILIPATAADLGSVTQPYGNLFLAGNVTLGNNSGTITATSTVVPKISGLTYPNGETAAIPTGGETIIVNGSGFLNGINVYANNLIVGSTSLISGTQISFTSPVLAAGNYPLAVVNSDGGSATFVAGITYSNVPVWTTSAGSLGTYQEGNTVLSTIAATDGALSITYSITSGSLPGGLSLGSANGNITGTLSNVVSSSVTYNFTVGAADPANQVVTRNFSYVINGDSITWSSPTNCGSYRIAPCVAMSNITLSATSTFGRSVTYNAVCLPTGVSLSGGNITGTPTVLGNKTATIYANTNTKSASISVTFKVAAPTVAATGGTVTTVGCYKIHTFTSGGAFTVTAGGTVQYLIVGGGGGGGGNCLNVYGGSGAGAGGFVTGCATITAQTYAISVGGGGVGGGRGSYRPGTNGCNSSAFCIVAGGGGYGGDINSYCGGAGASSGGAAGGGYWLAKNVTFGSQGHRGGDQYGTNWGQTGGGGAGSAGVINYTRNGTSAAGDGLPNPISGSTIGECVSGTLYVAGGGGPGDFYYNPFGAKPGGKGGGGSGGFGTFGCAGQVNTGGGGGGSSFYLCSTGSTPMSGGQGGSGVVIVKYKYQ